MSTVTRPRRRAATSRRTHPMSGVVLAEQRIVIRNVNWEVYDRLSDAVDERQHVFLAYDGKDLEIMTKGRVHEDYRESFGRFVNALTFELRIRCRDLGETTWKRPEIMRGLESDLCYYFLARKLAADAKGLARKSNKIADYPNPDLAIEIDISPSEVDRPAIYAALKVSELWRFDGESVVIEQLQKKGTYALVDSSRFLPIRAEDILRWLVVEDTSDELAWEQRLREWIRAELAPRRKA